MAKKSSAPQRTDVEIEDSFTKDLTVPLNDQELLQRGARLAQLHADLGAHYVYADGIKADLKAKEAALESERSRIALAVRNKSELRQVPCERINDFGRGLVYEVRLDTNERIVERAMTAEERQEALDLGGAK